MERFRKDSMTVVNDMVTFDAAMSFLQDKDVLIIDTETSGLNVWQKDFMAGLGIGTTEFQFYFSFRHPDSSLDLDAVREQLRLFLHSRKVLCAYYASFDITVLFNAGLFNPYLQSESLKWVDIPGMARLIFYDQFPNLSLIGVVARLFGISCNDYDYSFKAFLKAKKIKRFADAPTQETAIYCMNDVYYESLVYQTLLPIIKSRQLENVFNTECQITPVIWKMEERGVAIDFDKCKEMIAQIDKRVTELQEDIGANVNVGSSKDLRALFTELELKSVIQTSSGKDSWNAEALLFSKHPVADKIRLVRSLNKIKNTYLENFLQNGMLRGAYKSWGTVTGRFISDIAQTLPKMKIILSEEHYKTTNETAKEVLRTKATSLLRKQQDFVLDDSVPYMRWLTYGDEYEDEIHLSAKRPLIARDGFTLIGYDFSQMEIRVLFRYINTLEVLKLLDDEKWDAHGWVASKVWNIAPTDENFVYRRNLSKAISFGIIYGEGLDSLTAHLNVSKEDAKKFRNAYLDMIPGVRAFLSAVPQKLMQRGYVHNFFGRRYSTSPDMSYKLVNYLIQGTSADLIKYKMVEVSKYLEQFKSHMLLQIHDELVFEIANDELLFLVPKLKEMLEEDLIGVHLPVSVSKYYPSFAHKIKL